MTTPTRLDALRSAALAVLLLLPSTALAQRPPQPDGVIWSLGLGVISAPRPYKGASNSTLAVPLLELYAGRFYVQGIRAGYHFVDTPGFNLDVRANLRFTGLSEDDSPYLVGMDERKETIDLGLGAGWRWGAWGLSASAAVDALGRSDGTELAVDGSWRKSWGGGRFTVIPSLGVVWQSSEIVDYYFGVRPHEALPERPEYQGSAALNYRAGVTAIFRITRQVSTVLNLRGQRLANEIHDSPIVDDEWGTFGLLGLTYRF